MTQVHKKIQELKLRAAPVTTIEGYRNAVDLKISATVEDRIVKGYLIVWGVKDTYDTVFVKGCCARSIRERGPESDAKQKIAHLWQHECDNPTGRFTVLREDGYGLYFEAELDEIPIGDRELKQIRSGTLNQFSVGFNYIWDMMEFDEDTESIMLYEIELMEGSVVTFGSNDQTHAVRSPEQLMNDKEELMDHTEEFIRSLPRGKQLELRQLIKRHYALASLKPDIKDQLEKTSEGTLKVGDYKIDLTNF